MKALGDEMRFRIARILANHEGDLCVCELVDILRRPQYAVSRAAQELRRSGLVTERRDGKLAYYRLAGDPFAARIASALRDVPPGEEFLRYDLERTRWRIDLRANGKCVVTYRKTGSDTGAVASARTAPVGGNAPSGGGDAEASRKRRVLVICVHNTARSQIAEEYLRSLGGDLFEVESAGLNPGAINPFVAASLLEEGIDISRKRTRSVVDLYREGRTFEYVITVCSRKAEENCPVFPGPVRRLSWPFPDPSRFSGDDAAVAAKVRELRDAIKKRIEGFIAEERVKREQP